MGLGPGSLYLFLTAALRGRPGSPARVLCALGWRRGVRRGEAPRTKLDSRMYRAALWLCPAGFRHEYAQEMARDFQEAHDEAATRGGSRLWWLRLAMAIDLARTV